MSIENLPGIVLEGGIGHIHLEKAQKLQKLASHEVLPKLKRPVIIAKLPTSSRSSEEGLILYKGGFYTGRNSKEIVRMTPVFSDDIGNYVKLIEEYELSGKDIDLLKNRLDELNQTGVQEG